MGRGGRSPDRTERRRRSKSRERDFERRKKHGHEKDRPDRRGRSRSPIDRSFDRDSRRHDERRYNWRSYSKSPSPSHRDRETTKKKFVTSRPHISEADLKDKTPDEQEMMKLMGFCGFDTTKGKRVEGNAQGAVHVILKRKYRQYMNRKGGFNRPLDFVA